MSRSEAARINGAQSHGPTSEAGKAASSRNALRHGLTSAQVVIPGESPEEYEALVESFIEEFNPVTLREHDLLSEAAAARWRLRRLTIMEQAAFTAEFERVRNDAANAKLTPEQLNTQAWNAVTLSPAMKQIHRHESRLRRIYEKARIELEEVIIERLRFEREFRQRQQTADYLAAVEAEIEASRAQKQEREERAAAQRRTSHSAPAENKSKTARVQNEPVGDPAPGASAPSKRAA